MRSPAFSNPNRSGNLDSKLFDSLSCYFFPMNSLTIEVIKKTIIRSKIYYLHVLRIM